MSRTSSNQTNSIVYTVQSTLHSLHEWASSQKSPSCGTPRSNRDPEMVIIFENGRRASSTARKGGNSHYEASLFDDTTSLFGGETKTDDNSQTYLQALRCTAKDFTAVARRSFNCPVASDDLSCNSEDEQMRRLGSWGTFGTLATNESLEDALAADHLASVRQFDDDGNMIDPLLLEKAKLNREKLRGGKTKRAVKFAYPPITSLKQCPRVDPTDLDRLFFSTEELDTYENDRRSTGTVDDVEIVAVSTSLSDHESSSTMASNTTPPTAAVPPPIKNHESGVSDGSSMSQKSGLAKYLSPKTSGGPLSSFSSSRKGGGGGGSSLELDVARQGTSRDAKNRRGTPRHQSNNTSHHSAVEKPKEKRLLKSVQIFLRARSTGN